MLTPRPVTERTLIVGDIHGCLAELRALTDAPWIDFGKERVQLQPEGFAYSDALGPWLYAPKVRRRMQEFELR